MSLIIKIVIIYMNKVYTPSSLPALVCGVLACIITVSGYAKNNEKNPFNKEATTCIQHIPINHEIESSISDNSFSIRATGEKKKVTISESITGNRSFRPFTSKSPAYALAITGSIKRQSNDYLVRVILKDTGGNEYCVFESYGVLNHTPEFSFADYCEETALLNGIVPDALDIIVQNASLNLESLTLLLGDEKITRNEDFKTNYQRIRREQVLAKAANINEYNKAQGRLWRAGVTELSLKSFSEKKRILGMNNDSFTGGLEYYACGIFEFDGDLNGVETHTRNESQFADSFSWCNMHGKNWMTSIKTQGEAGYCFHFAVVGCAEAMTNLYYNQKIDLDLSEEELASCSGMSSNPYYGTYYSEMYKPFVYFRDNGVCDETAYPYNPSPSGVVCLSDEITPNELVKIDGYGSVTNTEDSIKYALINRGPLVTGINKPGWLNHAMVLVGWEKLHAGQTVYFYINENGQADGHHVVREDDPHIGMTVYIFKNSCGLGDPNSNDGYFYYIPNSWAATASPTYYCKLPVTTMSYTDDDIVCQDADGDGYYFWGLGAKPLNCPSWVPDTPDGDDSDISYGVMDNYGNLVSLPAGITIKTDTTYASAQSDSLRYGIVNGGTLRITGNINMTGNASIRVCEGGTLIVDGGIIQNADITLIPGSTMIIRNGGTIRMASGKSLEIPIGVEADIEEGSISQN